MRDSQWVAIIIVEAIVAITFIILAYIWGRADARQKPQFTPDPLHDVHAMCAAWPPRERGEPPQIREARIRFEGARDGAYAAIAEGLASHPQLPPPGIDSKGEPYQMWPEEREHWLNLYGDPTKKGTD